MADHAQNLSLIIDLVRSGRATTRPELIRSTGLGRAVVLQRVDAAIQAGILVENDEGRSTGGRPSPVLRMNADRGFVIAAVFGATRLHVALADIAGQIIADRFVAWDIRTGPTASLEQLFDTIDALLPADCTDRLWGAAVGLPGPVDYALGGTLHPPLMGEEWHGFRVRTAVERRYQVPAWVDNDANLMALGSWDRTRQASGDNVVLIKGGTGIGAGIISRGRLHRGARGAAGDIGHVIVADDSQVACVCGKYGCLDAYAAGWALARDAEPAAREGRSAYLADRYRENGAVDFEDVVVGSQRGDAFCRELVLRAGEMIGREVANLVNTFNPSTVYLGGNLVRTGEMFRATVEDAIRRRSPALATDELVIANIPLQHYEGVFGAATLAVDEIFYTPFLRSWFELGSPESLQGHTDGFSETFDLTERSRIIQEFARDARQLTPLPM